jgi:hypothetical protein
VVCSAGLPLVSRRIRGAEVREQGGEKDRVAVVESADVGAEHGNRSFGLEEDRETGDLTLLM